MSLATHAPEITTTATAAESAVAWAEMEHSQASPLTLTFALPSGQTFNGSAAVRCEIRKQGNASAVPEARVSITNPTGSSVTVTFTSAETNLPVAGDATKYNLYFYSEAAGVHLLAWRCKLHLVADETAASDAGTPPAVSALWLTEAVADTLYQPLGEGAAVWGGITGTMADQTDLNDFHTNLLSNQDFMQGQIDDLAAGATTYSQKSLNLSDLASASTALFNLGGAAKAANLSDLASTATARTNLGCNDAANITTGNLAVARIATALTTPGAIGGTTPSTIAGTSGTFSGNVTAAGSVTSGANNGFAQSGKGVIYYVSDGVLGLYNNSSATLSRLNLGPATSGNVAIKPNGAVIEVRLADDSAYASMKMLNLVATGSITLGAFTVGTLPSASSNTFASAAITDSLAPTVGSTVASGGSAKCVVRSNGTAWKVVEVL